jgi:hypothetical protein
MFKKNNYSKRALSTFEIVGSFIVDLYYNHFYQEAKRIRIDGRVESITDGYKHAIKAYLNSFENPESYRKTIVGIHKYYYTTTRFGSISFSECVNEIVKHFIPEDFFESTTNQQRDGILRMVLMNSVKQFSSDILCSNLLDTLIDNHGQEGIVRRMQDKMVQALMFEREKMFQKIFNVSNKPKNGGDFTVVMKMKSEMIKLVKENHTLTSKYGRLKDKSIRLLGIVKEQKEKMDKLQEPTNTKLEYAEQEHDKYHDDRRREEYNTHNPEQNFDKYQKEHSTLDGREDRTLYIPNDQPPRQKEKYPYMRPPRTDSSYRHEPPPDNVTRFEPYTYKNDTHKQSELYSPMEITTNKYDKPEEESTQEDHTDNMDVYVKNTTVNDDNDPVLSIAPSNDEFFSDNILDIN